MDEITLDNLTPVAAAMLASALLSFVWEWFPGIAEKWARLTGGQKAWINAAVVLALSIGITAGACYWWGGVCPEGGFGRTVGNMLLAFFLSFATNQSVHRSVDRRVWGKRLVPEAKSVEY